MGVSRCFCERYSLDATAGAAEGGKVMLGIDERIMFLIGMLVGLVIGGMAQWLKKT